MDINVERPKNPFPETPDQLQNLLYGYVCMYIHMVYHIINLSHFVFIYFETDG